MASNFGYSLIWVILLIFVTWPVSCFLAAVWLFLMPFESCFEICRDINNSIEKYVMWPRDVGAAISNGQTSCPAP